MPYEFTFLDFMGIAPALLALLAGLVIIVVDIFLSRGDDREIMPVTSAGAVIGVFLLVACLWNTRASLFAGAIQIDRFGVIGAGVAAFAALVTVLGAPRFLQRNQMEHGEFYGLVLFSFVGMFFMCVARDLITAFVALETMSLAIYGLVGMHKKSALGAEAATKYFVVGAFASGFLTLGIALIYVGTGTVVIPELVGGIMANWERGGSYLMLPGLALMIIGFGFKIGAAPFHNWVADVYQGAPTPVTGFMSVGVKVAAAVLMGRVFLSGFRAFHLYEVWMPILAILSVVSMIIGGLSALVQRDLKRMLGYSAVSSAGFLLMAFLGDFGSNGQPHALLIYLVAYSAATAGAFMVLSLLDQSRGEDVTQIAHLQGLAARRPGLAAAMALFVLSLAGMPGTAGFIGKLMVLWEAVSGPELTYPLIGISSSSVYVAVLGIFMSLIALGYYLPVIVSMYMHEPTEDFTADATSWSGNVAIWLCVLATLGFGLFPGPLMQAATIAAAHFVS